MTTVKKLNETTYEVTAVLNGEEFASMKKHVLTHFKDAKVDGFRPGKVPASVIEKTFKNEINEQILNHLISDAYREAVTSNELRPIADIKLEKFDVKEDLAEAIFTIPVLPEIKLGEYKGVKVERETVNVTEEKVNEELENLRKRAGKLKETEAGTKAELNDTANIDFEGFIDGVAFDGGKAEGFDLTLGSGSFIDNFEDQIVGHVAGDEFDVNVSFPENYGAANLAGKPALFKVKLNTVKRTEEAKLDDELAKELGHETLEELTVKTKENLEKREETRISNDLRNKVVEAVLETTEFEVPAALTDREVQNQINRFAQQMQMQGLSLNQYFEMTGQTVETMQEQMREGAEKAVKTDLVLSEIAKVEKIEATEEEVNNEIEMMAAMYGMDKDTIVADIKKAGNYEAFIDNTKFQIENRKTIEFLVENAK